MARLPNNWGVTFAFVAAVLLVTGVCASWAMFVSPVLRSLDEHAVVHTVGGIEPEVRGRLEASAERDQHCLRDASLRQPDLLRAIPVYAEEDLRLVHDLANPHVRCTRQPLDLARHPLGRAA